MPPLAAAAEILASPVANTRMPHASARPTLGPVAAGPAETGPFMLMVIGAVTGPWPTAAHPLRSAAHVKASIERFSIGRSSFTVGSPVPPDPGGFKVTASPRDGRSARLGRPFHAGRLRDDGVGPRCAVAPAPPQPICDQRCQRNRTHEHQQARDAVAPEQ